MRKLAAIILALLCVTAPARSQTQQSFSAYVSSLPLAGTIGAGDALYVLQGGVSKKIFLTSVAGVGSVSNADGTLTIAPTTGAIIASLALGHANTWTGVQTFTNSKFALLGSSTGATTFSSANSGSSNFTVTIPAATDTVAELGQANAFTGNNSYSGTSTWTGSLITNVRSSGASTVTASATTDYFFCLDPTSNAIALNLPATPATGLTYLVKDCTGQAATHHITITPSSGNVDGSATFVMSTNYQSVGVTYTGSQWSIN